MGLDLVSTACAICGVKDNATVLYPANFDASAFQPGVFSARRLPDMLHYRIVRCNTCGLVRSDPIADAGLLQTLYRQSSFTYAADTPNLSKTYGHYLQKTEKYGVPKRRLLEIGCGDGFFLQEALTQGFAAVSGVEPGEEAIDRASADIRPHIVSGAMRPGLFPPGSFSLVCMFQTLDHIPDPNALLRECFDVLEPGGLVLCLNHNVQALSAHLLDERSPIIDIEHTYLYSPLTITRLFEQNGFHVLEAGPAWNVIRLYSLLRLMPFPAALKQKILALAENDLLGKLSFWLPLGNLYLIAQKP